MQMFDRVTGEVQDRVAEVVEQQVVERIAELQVREEIEHRLAALVRQRETGDRIDCDLAAEVVERRRRQVVRSGPGRDRDPVERPGDVARVSGVDDVQNVRPTRR